MTHVAIDEIPSFTHAMRDGRYTLRPTCLTCSVRKPYEQTPRLEMVDRVIIFRDVARGYVVISHCHGSTETTLMGYDTPTDYQIQTLKVFAHVKARPVIKPAPVDPTRVTKRVAQAVHEVIGVGRKRLRAPSSDRR